MLYAREVIDLLAAFPDREWRMAEIVNHVARGRPSCKQQRDRVRQGVRRVLDELADARVVIRRPGRANTSPAMYQWRELPARETVTRDG